MRRTALLTLFGWFMWHLSLGQFIENELKVRFGSTPVIQAIDTDEHGNVFIGGHFKALYDISLPSSSLIKLDKNGTLDESFQAEINLDDAPSFPPDREVTIKSLKVLQDGKILLVRQAGTSRFWITRLNSNGSVDDSFNFENPEAEMRSMNEMLVLDNGKILLAGIGIHNDNEKEEPEGLYPYTSRLILYNSNGSRDHSFNGKYENRLWPTSVGLNTPNIAQMPNGQILVVGVFSEINDVEVHGLVKLNLDGTVDTSFSNFTQQNEIDPLYLDVGATANEYILLTGEFDTINNISLKGSVALNSEGAVLRNVPIDIIGTRPSNEFSTASNYIFDYKDGGVVLIVGDFFKNKTVFYSFDKSLNLLDSTQRETPSSYLFNSSYTFDNSTQSFYINESYQNDQGLLRNGIARYNEGSARDNEFQLFLMEKVTSNSDFIIGNDGNVFTSGSLYEGISNSSGLSKFNINDSESSGVIVNSENFDQIIPMRNSNELLLINYFDDYTISKVDYEGVQVQGFSYTGGSPLSYVATSENDEIFIARPEYNVELNQNDFIINKLDSDGSLSSSGQIEHITEGRRLRVVKPDNEKIIVVDQDQNSDHLRLSNYDPVGNLLEQKVIELRPKDYYIKGDSLYVFRFNFEQAQDGSLTSFIENHIYNLNNLEKMESYRFLEVNGAVNLSIKGFHKLKEPNKVFFYESYSNQYYKYDLEQRAIDKYFDLNVSGELLKTIYVKDKLYLVGNLDSVMTEKVYNVVQLNTKNALLKKPILEIAESPAKNKLLLSIQDKNFYEEGYNFYWGYKVEEATLLRTIGPQDNAFELNIDLSNDDYAELDNTGTQGDQVYIYVQAFNKARLSEPSNTMFIGYRTVTAITELQEEAQLIYPNPTNSLVYLSKVYFNQRVSLNSVSGILIFEQHITEGTSTIDMSKLPSGIYILSVKNQSEIAPMKIIKK